MAAARASSAIAFFAASTLVSRPTPRITTWFALSTSRRNRCFSSSSIVKLFTVTMPESTSLKRE